MFRYIIRNDELQIFNSPFIVKKKARSGVNTIKYQTWPDTPYGNEEKTLESIMHKKAKTSALSQLVITSLQEADKTV